LLHGGRKSLFNLHKAGLHTDFQFSLTCQECIQSCDFGPTKVTPMCRGSDTMSEPLWPQIHLVCARLDMHQAAYPFYSHVPLVAASTSFCLLSDAQESVLTSCCDLRQTRLFT
jgi:hypothetical protein